MHFPSSSQDSPGESVMPPHVGVLPSRRPSGQHSHHPLRVGPPWGTGTVVGAPGPCPCTPPGALTDPTGKCLPPVVGASHTCDFGSPSPPLHIHTKALHSHLHPHRSQHTLTLAMLLCSVSPSRLLRWLLARSLLLHMPCPLCVLCPPQTGLCVSGRVHVHSLCLSTTGLVPVALACCPRGGWE